MGRELISRRAALAAVAGLSAVGGCLDDRHCQTIVDATETVERRGLRVYDVDAEPGQRLYVQLRRIDGPPARLSVFDPNEEPLVERRDVDRIERVIDTVETGTYSVVTENDSSTEVGQWLTTVAVYRGWCPDVF